MVNHFLRYFHSRRPRLSASNFCVSVGGRWTGYGSVVLDDWFCVCILHSMLRYGSPRVETAADDANL